MLVYVDDVLVISNALEVVVRVKQSLRDPLELKILEKTSIFLVWRLS